MLQQTKVAQVIDFYMTFLRSFPDLRTLAGAEEREVLKNWQGLGYYSRALNIHASAKLIVGNFNGIFPDTYDQIRSLKGIGDYTAAAIASIAFELPHAAVDGNVKRVAARYYGISDSVSKASTVKQITDLLNSEITKFSPGQFNQAVIELGALICTPTRPDCANCPLQDGCVAFAKGLQDVIPVKDSKKAPRTRYLDFVFLEYRGSTWILRRDHSAIWKGLYEFPNIESGMDTINGNPPDGILELVENQSAIRVLDLFEEKHQLTHQTIFARFWHLSGKPSNIVTENKRFIKIRTEELIHYPVHRLMHKYLVKRGFAEKNKHS